jgi:hypothetical protein
VISWQHPHKFKVVGVEKSGKNPDPLMRSGLQIPQQEIGKRFKPQIQKCVDLFSYAVAAKVGIIEYDI